MSQQTDTNTSPPQEQQSPFRDRNFLLLWLGQLISNLGDAALLIAVPVAVYNATGSRGALSIVTIAGALPTLLIGLFAGVFVDRWNRQRTMVVSDLGRACAVLVMLDMHGSHDVGHVWLFYLATFLIASFSCFFSPARSAVMKALLPKKTMLRGNAVMTSGMQITGLLGPAIGGLLLATVHRQGVFLFDAGTFVISALCIVAAHFPAAEVERRVRRFDRVWQDMVEGVQYIAETPVLAAIITLTGIGIIGAEISNTLEYAFVKDIWHAASLFGYLMSAFGLGMVTAGLLVAGPLRNVDAKDLLVRGFAVFAVGGLAWALSPNMVCGAAALFVFGLGNVLLNIPMYTLFLEHTKSEMMGRVMSASAIVKRLSMLIAGGLAAALIKLPLQPIFVGLAGVYLICTLLARPLLERRITTLTPNLVSPEQVLTPDAESVRP
jgi:MFS family permease